MVGISGTGCGAGIIWTKGQQRRRDFVACFAGSIFINNRIKETQWEM